MTRAKLTLAMPPCDRSTFAPLSPDMPVCISSRMATYRSVEAWHAAVRHAGALLQLPTLETGDDNPLPYPALEHASARPNTKLVSGLHLVEHPPPPGEFAPAVCCRCGETFVPAAVHSITSAVFQIKQPVHVTAQVRAPQMSSTSSQKRVGGATRQQAAHRKP